MRKLNQNDTWETMESWLKENLSDDNSIPADGSKIAKVPTDKGIYFWFMHPDGYNKLSRHIPIKPIEPRCQREINGVKYDLVYLGTAGTGKKGNSHLQERLKWHLLDNKSVSAVRNGFMSTFRRTITPLLASDLIVENAQQKTDDFFEENLIIYWIPYPGSFKDVKDLVNQDEKILIKKLRPIFNLKENDNTSDKNHPSSKIQLRRNTIEKSTKNVIDMTFQTLSKQKKTLQKEVSFSIGKDKYQLSYNEKPILLKNGNITTDKIKPTLRKYIEEERLDIELKNKRGTDKTTHELAKEFIKYLTKLV